MNKPTHDKTLSTYLGMEVWSHTTRLAGRTRYQAVCVECGRDLCDIEFSDVALEDSAMGRELMVHAILERIEKTKCKCGERWHMPEFDAAQAQPLSVHSRSGFAYIGHGGKLLVA